MIFKWLRKRQREADLKILWPICKRDAPDLEHAKFVFAFHANNEPAWTKDYTEEELYHFINNLT